MYEVVGKLWLMPMKLENFGSGWFSWEKTWHSQSGLDKKNSQVNLKYSVEILLSKKSEKLGNNRLEFCLWTPGEVADDQENCGGDEDSQHDAHDGPGDQN